MVACIIAVIIFLSEGIHFTKNPERSAKKAIKSYMKEHKNELVKRAEIHFINIDDNQKSEYEENFHKAVCVAQNFETKSIDTLFFYYRLEKYNCCVVEDSRNVLISPLTSEQEKWVRKSKKYGDRGMTANEQKSTLDEWDEYLYYLRQMVAKHMEEYNIYRITDFIIDSKNSAHVTVNFLNSKYAIKRPIVLFYFDGKVEEPIVKTWEVDLRKGQMATKEFIFPNKGKANKVYCQVISSEIYTNDFLYSFLNSADDSFWRNILIDYYGYKKPGVTFSNTSKYLDYLIKAGYSPKQIYSTIDWFSSVRYYTDTFQDTPNSRHNTIKSFLEIYPQYKTGIHAYYNR